MSHSRFSKVLAQLLMVVLIGESIASSVSDFCVEEGTFFGNIFSAITQL